MKGLWLLILLSVIYPAADARAADGICACYYDTYGYCAYSYADGDGVPFNDASECTAYCDDTYGDAVTDTDFAEDADTEAGIDVGADCLESDEQAVTAASAAGEYSSDASSASTSTTTSKLLTPILSVDIPTVTFSDAIFTEEEGRRYISVNYLGDYVAGVYTYLLGFATTIAIVMIMVSGLQWALGGASPEAIGKAKSRVKNATTGLVLLLGTYLILFTVNPELVALTFPELQIVENEGLYENEAESVSGTVATSFGTPSGSNISGAAINLVPSDRVADIEAVAMKLLSQGYGLSITSGYRSLEEQKRQIAKKCKNPPGSATCDPKDGKTVACILQDNDPANCPHTTGYALDIWGTEAGSTAQCITQSQCQPSLGASDPCRLNECQAALITAMKEQGFCNLSSEAWHFEKPHMSTRCN